MRKFVPGALAGLLVAALLAAPAYAATVTVRIEGDAQTLAQATVTPSGAAVGKPGSPTCAGGSALDALNVATAGSWSGPYFDGLGYAPEVIMGESHAFADRRATGRSGSTTRYRSAGLCDVQVQQGDACSLPRLLDHRLHARLAAAPDRGARDGGARPDRHGQGRAAHGAGLPGDRDDLGARRRRDRRVGGADGHDRRGRHRGGDRRRVGAGGRPGDQDGHGPLGKAAACVTTGSDGACGSGTPGGTGGGTTSGKDTTAPTATLAGLKKMYARGRGPRELHGTVSADPSGIKSVRLAVSRRAHGRCWAFAGGRERFVRHRCGGWKSFRIGDRADWSYLLPRRLGPGRYTIRRDRDRQGRQRRRHDQRIRVR